MNKPAIDAALRGARDTRQVVLGTDILPAAPALFRQSFGDTPVLVVADDNTFRVAGRAVLDHFRSTGCALAEPFVFPGTPVLHADYEQVSALRTVLGASTAIAVAVGSGTINDLTKLASYECGKPYMAVATAASMDGYVAFGAAITRDGFKQTMSCPAPQALLADTAIIAAAPRAMAASGYADLLGKVPAGADWIVADALGVEPIMPEAWSLAQSDLRQWLSRPAALRAGDPDAAEALMEGLVMSGLAMQVAQSSRPASGAEHQFSHLWEMEGLSQAAHGFKVGLGALAIAALYEWLLTQDLAALDLQALSEAWPTAEALEREITAVHANPVLAGKAVHMSLAKHLTGDQLNARLRRVQRLWPEVRKRLQAQLMSAAEIRSMLMAAGCPVEPGAIGLALPTVRDTFYRSRHIRSRYTVLDLVAEAGYLPAAMQALFAPGGFYGSQVAE